MISLFVVLIGIGLLYAPVASVKRDTIDISFKGITQKTYPGTITVSGKKVLNDWPSAALVIFSLFLPLFLQVQGLFFSEQSWNILRFLLLFELLIALAGIFFTWLSTETILMVSSGAWRWGRYALLFIETFYVTILLFLLTPAGRNLRTLLLYR